MNFQPKKNEYNPYYKKYIDLIDYPDLITLLLKSNRKTLNLLRKLPEEKYDFVYSKGKWTIPEIILHLIDTERIMSYRILRFSRNDKTELPGFEQDDYVKYSGAKSRQLESIITEFAAVRNATLELIKSLTPSTLTKSGIASGWKISVRALCCIIAGHEIHHRNVIEERYLS